MKENSKEVTDTLFATISCGSSYVRTAWNDELKGCRLRVDFV